ncbi:MAG: RimJ/RimL family protein N-acetyltransferase [Phenylobacterium sp.]|jgi:RimJ/RimL family protein N-acetyltransferase
MPITYQIIDQHSKGFRHIDALLALTADIVQQNAAPYLYPPDRNFFIRTQGIKCASILAYSGEQLVGYAVLEFLQQWPDYLRQVGPCEHAAMILFTLVHPDYRGQGINKQMTRMRLDMAKTAGIKRLFSTVHPDNIASWQTLCSVGMVEIDQRPMFDEQVMRKLMFMRL